MQISTYLDARRRAELALDPNHPGCAAEAAMRALRAAQAAQSRLKPAFDRDFGPYAGHPADPRTEDDDALTEADARDEATAQVLSYAESVADWLAKACDTAAGRQPLDVRALEPLQIIDGSPALLLTVLMNGDQQQAMRALGRLRELAAVEFAPEINERAAAMLREAA